MKQTWNKNTTLFLLLIMVFVGLGIYAAMSFFQTNSFCNGSSNEALCLSDRAVVEKKLALCDSAKDTKTKEACLIRAIPPLATDEEVCKAITFERGAILCMDYVKKVTLARNKTAPSTYRYFEYATKPVVVEFADGTKKDFSVSIADTDDKKRQGLSFKTSLKEGEGMLFSYDTPRKVVYHMRDMLFSIDIIYADKNGQVLNTFRSLPSCVVYTGECSQYGSSGSDVMHVLEIPPQGKDVVKIHFQ